MTAAGGAKPGLAELGSTTDSGAAGPGTSAAAPAIEPISEPAITPFLRLGGETGVRGLVDRFYDLMDLEPQFAGLRALHPQELSSSRDKLFWFLCGWLGGPNHYIERFGHPMLRARHMPYNIGLAERDQWMACMMLAMQEAAVEEGLAARLSESFFGTADWMRNR